MACQHQGLESPSETAAQQSTCSQSYSKNNQHTAQCVFGERACEPSSKKQLKYIMMEWYIYLNEGNGLPAAWSCPLIDCHEPCTTFASVFDHLEKCQHLKSNTRRYTCPACQNDVRMPARGHGGKTMLKIRKSLDNLLSYPSSPARSPSTGSSLPSPLSSDAGLSQEGDQVSPASYLCGNSQVNAQTTNSFNQHNRSFDIDPIVTKFNSTPAYVSGVYTNNSYPSSTTTPSSGESGIHGAFSPQGIQSAVSLPTQLTWSPSYVAWIQTPTIDTSNVSQWVNMPQQPCNFQQVGDLPYRPALPELSEANLLQETANMQDVAFLSTGANETNPNYRDVQQEFQGEYKNFLQNQWIQREGFSSYMPESVFNSPEENGFALEVAGSTYPVHDSFSPTASSDVTMGDSPRTSSGGDSSPAAASDISTPKCQICQWEPDKGVKRSLKRLEAAVDKHFKRNHNSKDFRCPICDQVFKNRPDNVKPHVARKHAEMLASLYPTKAVLDFPQVEKPAALARAGTRRRASMPQSASQVSPGRGKHMRFKRG